MAKATKRVPRRKSSPPKPQAKTDDDLPPNVEWRTVRVLVYTGPMEGSTYIASRVEARLSLEQRLMLRRMRKAQQMLDKSWNSSSKHTPGNTVQKLLQQLSDQTGLNGKGE